MRVFALIFIATTLFSQTTDETAWKIIERGVHEGNPIKRRQALLALSLTMPTARVVGLVTPALNDKDPVVREAACDALGQMKARTAIPKLHEAVADAIPEVTFAAAKALFNMGDQMGVDILTDVLAGEQTDASGFLSSSFRSMRLKLHDRKALLLMGMQEGAGFAGPFGVGVPIAQGLLTDSQASGRTVAALLLANDRSQQSLEALKQALAEKNWTVRTAAARAIAKRNATSLYTSVAPLLNDKKDEVEFSAAATIIRLRQPGAETLPAPRVRVGKNEARQ